MGKWRRLTVRDGSSSLHVARAQGRCQKNETPLPLSYTWSPLYLWFMIYTLSLTYLQSSFSNICLFVRVHWVPLKDIHTTHEHFMLHRPHCPCRHASHSACTIGSWLICRYLYPNRYAFSVWIWLLQVLFLTRGSLGASLCIMEAAFSGTRAFQSWHGLGYQTFGYGWLQRVCNDVIDA